MPLVIQTRSATPRSKALALAGESPDGSPLIGPQLRIGLFT